jgi:SAM-dependent methyltransferase
LSDNIYETPRLLAEYLLFHYGKAEEILPPDAPAGMAAALDFPARTAAWFSRGVVSRALDLGCAVGRSSYELSRSSGFTCGIDFSRGFVETARKVGAGPVSIGRQDEGFRETLLEVGLPAGIDPGKVVFEVGDAMDLRADLGEFDRVHAANLLCRLSEPARLLERLPALVRPGGELVLATPCTWLEDFTPRPNWPQGETLDWLRDSLAGTFELAAFGDEAFLIRETARKFQWTRAQVSRWTRLV